MKKSFIFYKLLVKLISVRMKKVSFKKILNVFTLLEFNNIFKNFKANVSVCSMSERFNFLL